MNEHLERIESLIDLVEDWSRLPDKPVVSVCMTTFNHERYIRQALDSILMQKVSFPYEIVIGEDRSTDTTREVVLEYQQQHSDKVRLRLARKNLYSQGLKPGIGVRAACRGKYIALLEGDDYWTDPLKLQKQVDFLEAHPEYVLAFCNVKVVHEDGICNPHLGYSDVPCDYDCGVNQIVTPKETSSIKDLAIGNYIHTPGVVLRRDAINSDSHWCQFLQNCPTGDWALYMHAALHGSIKYMADVMAAYRVHQGGVWSQMKMKKRMETAISVFYWASRCSAFPFEYRNSWLDKSVQFYFKLLDTGVRSYDIIVPADVCGTPGWFRRVVSVMLARISHNNEKHAQREVKINVLIRAYERSYSLRIGRSVLLPVKIAKKMVSCVKRQWSELA